QVLDCVFHELYEHRVLLEGMVLKPNMVISGKKAPNRAPPQTVAEATVRVLKRHVPPAVPGIAFLSGGQSPAEATLHLSLINRLGPLPWALTFSYGRARRALRPGRAADLLRSRRPGAPRPHHRHHGAERHRQDHAPQADHGAGAPRSGRVARVRPGARDPRSPRGLCLAPPHGHVVPE